MWQIYIAMKGEGTTYDLDRACEVDETITWVVDTTDGSWIDLDGIGGPDGVPQFSYYNELESGLVIEGQADDDRLSESPLVSRNPLPDPFRTKLVMTDEVGEEEIESEEAQDSDVEDDWVSWGNPATTNCRVRLDQLLKW
jgi:hypothetical protein